MTGLTCNRDILHHIQDELDAPSSQNAEDTMSVYSFYCDFRNTITPIQFSAISKHFKRDLGSKLTGAIADVSGTRLASIPYVV